MLVCALFLMLKSAVLAGGADTSTPLPASTVQHPSPSVKADANAEKQKLQRINQLMQQKGQAPIFSTNAPPETPVITKAKPADIESTKDAAGLGAGVMKLPGEDKDKVLNKDDFLKPGEEIDTAALSKLKPGAPVFPAMPELPSPIIEKLLTGGQVLLVLIIFILVLRSIKHYYDVKKNLQFRKFLWDTVRKVESEIKYTRTLAIETLSPASFAMSENAYSINEDNPVYLPMGMEILSITGESPIVFDPQGIPKGGTVIEIGTHQKSLHISIQPEHGNIEIMEDYDMAMVVSIKDKKAEEDITGESKAGEKTS